MADENSTTPVSKKKTKASAKPSTAKPKTSAVDTRMDSQLQAKMDAKFNSLMDMMKNLADSRTGLACASHVAEISYLPIR